MELILSCVLFVLSLIVIIVSGNCMVSNAVKISDLTGIPQALIGATFVSLATTLPELNVTIFSALDGLSELAIGNAMGSIIFNMTFIVGIVLLFTKNKIPQSVLGINFYIMCITLLLIFVFSALNMMTKWVGMILLTKHITAKFLKSAVLMRASFPRFCHAELLWEVLTRRLQISLVYRKTLL